TSSISAVYSSIWRKPIRGAQMNNPALWEVWPVFNNSLYQHSHEPIEAKDGRMAMSPYQRILFEEIQELTVDDWLGEDDCTAHMSFRVAPDLLGPECTDYGE